MRGSGAAIQLGGRGQTMGGWGAKTGTTTTSVWVKNCVSEDGLRVPTSDFRVAWIFDEVAGSAEIGGHQLPVAEREQNRRGDHVRIRRVVCHNHRGSGSHCAYNGRTQGPHWPLLARIPWDLKLGRIVGKPLWLVLTGS